MTKDESSFQKLDVLSRRGFIAGMIASVVAVGGVLPIGLSETALAEIDYTMRFAVTGFDHAGSLIREIVERPIVATSGTALNVISGVTIPADEGEYFTDGDLFDDDGKTIFYEIPWNSDVT